MLRDRLAGPVMTGQGLRVRDGYLDVERSVMFWLCC
jgi:hypothetical protein